MNLKVICVGIGIMSVMTFGNIAFAFESGGYADEYVVLAANTGKQNSEPSDLITFGEEPAPIFDWAGTEQRFCRDVGPDHTCCPKVHAACVKYYQNYKSDSTVCDESLKGCNKYRDCPVRIKILLTRYDALKERLKDIRAVKNTNDRNNRGCEAVVDFKNKMTEITNLQDDYNCSSKSLTTAYVESSKMVQVLTQEFSCPKNEKETNKNRVKSADTKVNTGTKPQNKPTKKEVESSSDATFTF
ncbi:MAG: hypothetical protein ACOY4F_00285 [Thermodesulfobacteriota bacterium]